MTAAGGAREGWPVGISPEDFARMTARLAGKAGAADQPAALVRTRRPDRWLGLDPSLRGTGWGVVHFRGEAATLVACGVWKCPPAWPRSRCLSHISVSMNAILREHQPEACAVEALFFAQNQRTTLILGEARGAALAAVATAGLAIYEMAPRRVKRAIVGYGAAGKPAVARMVERLIGVEEQLAADAADALAVALACANTWARMGQPGPASL